MTATFLPPVENPKGLLLKSGYYFTRRQFGKVMTPLSVFSARLPSAFTMFYGKIGKLDGKLVLVPGTAKLIRERVATINGCLYCMDANRFAAIKTSADNAAKFDALDDYLTSPLFDEAERAALEYATELTRDRSVNPATFARLRTHFSEREVCEIVWLVASEHIYNVTNIGLNIGSDGFCEVSAAA